MGVAPSMLKLILHWDSKGLPRLRERVLSRAIFRRHGSKATKKQGSKRRSRVISSNEPNFGKYPLIAYNLRREFLEASKEPDYRFHEGKGSAHLTGRGPVPGDSPEATLSFVRGTPVQPARYRASSYLGRGLAPPTKASKASKGASTRHARLGSW
ncbi:7738_t:CDS:2 [Dentiscutata heterogama]|uniref:7738_t:CDS:1 n=1 Tax=Dentiscutata heterogama TaxID=1316150 RepID=A0ACA9JY73_9GLOM|nr:7738_t:CDS:2 [Dentiscutata heterogama]